MTQLKRFLPLAIMLLRSSRRSRSGSTTTSAWTGSNGIARSLLALVERHPLAAPLAFMLIYAAAIALSIPGGAVLTMAGGFLFGVVPGTCYVVIAATIGATIVFLIARTALGDSLRRRAGPACAAWRRAFARMP